MTAQDISTLPLVRRLPPLGDIERALVRCDGLPAERWLVPLAGRTTWDAAVAAASQVGSAHIRAPQDVAIDPNGTLRILFPVVTGRTVHELLATPGWLTPGRCVTVLCPIADTVGAAHDAGVTLGGVSAAGIRVDARGAPVIDDIARAHAASPLPLSMRDKDPSHREDTEGFVGLWSDLRRVLETTGHAEAAASMPSAEQVLAQPDRLHHWAEAEPLLVPLGTPEGAPTDSAGLAPESSVRPVSAEECAPPTVGGPHNEASVVRPSIGARVLGSLALPAEISSGIASASETVTHRAAQLAQRARSVSRRQLVAAAVGLAIVAAVLITTTLGAGDAGESSTAQPAGISAPESDSSDVESGDGAPTGGGPADHSTASAEMPGVLGEPDPDDWGPIAKELVARWQQCLRDVRVICEGAIHPLAAVASRSSEEVEPVVTGLASTLASADSAVTLIERAGDVALLAVTGPETTAASLLLVRSEAGWRVRDAWS
ncbi:MAG TPA: hypothetical protein VFM95_01090 [Microcella sp.]|nr:hypothetical protein [Microcella sp.]